jgi:dATP pyrophosphohydrolase
MVLVRRGAEILVLHRASTYDAYWHLVAGAQEPGESAAQAASRELLEETGLDATVLDLGRPFAYALGDEPESVRARFAADVEQVTVTCFAAEAPAGWEPVLNDEHDEYRWCSREEAAELLFWPEPRELVLAL